ncbi:MAG: DNA-3-methyladenine glycosylase [Bryobacteraceae bacterium]
MDTTGSEASIVAPPSALVQGLDSRPILPRDFYRRPTVQVAKAILGQFLVHGERVGRIVEVEAYLGEEDRAAHAWHGRTARTEVLYGPPGHAYVYLIYGMYECLNIVAEPPGSPGCVLIRALEPLAGIERMRAARPNAKSDHALCAGPGKLTRAMGISRGHYGADFTAGSLTIRRAPVAARSVEIGVSGRIGIKHGADRLLRFFLAGNPCVSSHPGRPRPSLGSRALEVLF